MDEKLNAILEVISKRKNENIRIAKYFMENNDEEMVKYCHTQRDEDSKILLEVLNIIYN